MNFLAIRYLLSKKRQTILTLIGITLGTAGFISISGLMLGFQTYLLDQFINSDCHVRIQARDEPVNAESIRTILFEKDTVLDWISPPSGRKGEDIIDNIPGWKERLDRDPRVEAYALQLQYPVLTQFAKIATSTQLIGMDPQHFLKVSKIEPYATQGSFQNLAKGTNQIMIGEDLLIKLGAKIGDPILLSLGSKGSQPFKIIGTFKFGMRNKDEGIAYARLADVQSLARTPSKISSIAIRLNDVDDSLGFSTELAERSKELVQSWEQINESTLSVFKTQDIVRYAMTIAILVVAGFGIFNVLSMTVSQKRREIAILRSIGYEPNDITGLFLTQGTVLGFFGGIFGMVIGYVICVLLSRIEVAPGRAIGMGHMMISFEPRIYFIAFNCAFFSSALSSFIPAKGAGKMEPMDIMRSEG